MSDILAQMSVVLGLEISEFKRGIAAAKAELKGLVQFGESLKDVGQSLSTFLTLPLALAGAAAVKAFGESDAALKQVENGLRSTGNAAKLSSQELQNLAAQIQKKSVYGDDEVLQKVSTQLLTFSNITGETFKRTQQAAVDLSAKLGQDLQTSAIQLGKALNDPTQSLGALRRAGISFSADQIALIHTLQATGQLGKAQTLILGELERQYGGTAEAAAKAGTGGLKQLANQFNDLQEDFGKIIVEGIKPLIAFLSNLITSFQELSPAVKQTIVIALAVAAALGPVLFVVGGLIAALPLLAGAFAVLTGPIALIIAGIAALVVGIVAVASSGHNATAEFRDQKAAVDGLQKAVSPLLDRYDQLKSKTNLTKAEQEELRSIVQKVGEQIPTTITAFDGYGKALGINSTAARDFVKAQQEILAVKNRDAITEQRAEYARLSQQIQGATNALSQFNEKGQLVKFVGSGDDLGGDFFALTAKEITALQARLEGLRTARRGVGGLIDELKGIKPPVEQAGAATTNLTAIVDKNAKKMADALASLNKSLRDNASFFQVSGNEGAFFADKINILQGGIKSLISAGFGPASATIKAFVRQLREVPAELEALAPRQAKYKALPFDPLPAKLKAIKPEGDAVLKPYYDREDDAALQFAQSFQSILSGAFGDAAKVLGEGLGGILAGTQSVGEGLKSIFSGLIGTVGSFISKFGELLVAQATLTLAASTLATNPLTAPAAIGIGIAAIALGSAVSALSKSGPFGGSSGGGSKGIGAPSAGGGFTPSASAGSNQAPLNIKVEVVGTLRGAGKDLVGVITASDYRRLHSA